MRFLQWIVSIDLSWPRHESAPFMRKVRPEFVVSFVLLSQSCVINISLLNKWISLSSQECQRTNIAQIVFTDTEMKAFRQPRCSFSLKSGRRAAQGSHRRQWPHRRRPCLRRRPVSRTGLVCWSVFADVRSSPKCKSRISRWWTSGASWIISREAICWKRSSNSGIQTTNRGH